MNKEDAEKVNIALMQINRQLKDVYEFVSENETDNFEGFQKRFAKVLGYHIMGLQQPLWKEHPDLKPECMEGNLKVDNGIFNQSPCK